MNEAPRTEAFAEQADKESAGFGRIGVLLVNLGTPDDTDYWSMRRYLKEFLSDRRVIEVNPVLWWLILNGIVLTTRPSKSGEAYRSIWNEELDESPLRTITRARPRRSLTRSVIAKRLWSTGPCATAIRALPRASRRSPDKAATSCWSFRSIRNTRRRRRRPSTTRCSTS